MFFCNDVIDCDCVAAMEECCVAAAAAALLSGQMVCLAVRMQKKCRKSADKGADKSTVSVDEKLRPNVTFF